MASTVPAKQMPLHVFQPYRLSDPMTNIQCHCDDQTVTLTGSVTRFYHLQLAIEAGRKLAEGRKLDVQIEVVTPTGVFAPEDAKMLAVGPAN